MSVVALIEFYFKLIICITIPEEPVYPTIDPIPTDPAVAVPESGNIAGLLAIGIVGAASTLKRKLKPSKSTEKETTKVG